MEVRKRCTMLMDLVVKKGAQSHLSVPTDFDVPYEYHERPLVMSSMYIKVGVLLLLASRLQYTTQLGQGLTIAPWCEQCHSMQLESRVAGASS